MAPLEHGPSADTVPPEPGAGTARPHDAVAEWCRDAARWLHLGRRLSRTATETVELRDQLAGQLPMIVEMHGDLTLDVTPRSLVLDNVPVFIAEHAKDPTGAAGLERELSAVLHRDGVRRLHFREGLTRDGAQRFLDLLAAAAPACSTHEDLITSLWDADLPGMDWEAEEATETGGFARAAGASHGPSGHDSDWPLAEAPASDVHLRWLALEREESSHAGPFAERWRAEQAQPFAERSAEFVERLLARDTRRETAELLSASLVTWLATATQRGDWTGAREALSLVERVDPERRHSGPALEHALSGLDAAAITDRLDSDPNELQAQAFALAVRIGTPALPLLVAILGHSTRTRVRAGATTALAFAFADDPAPLGVLLTEPRWQVVRDTVFVLGQIGGPAVVPLLARAGRHVDARVRRAAVEALGQVPAEQARPVLLSQLDSQDVRALRSALAMLARDPDAHSGDAVLARVLDPGFASRAEEQRLALLAALPDLAGDAAVPALAQSLGNGGWFAKPTAERSAAAGALQRLNTIAARGVLEQGLRHRAAAVREACEHALGQGPRA